MTIKRYGLLWADTEISIGGDYVLYEDHRSALDALERENAGLREATLAMETACEQLAATRPMEVYDAMITAGQADAMIALDNARRAARAALDGRG